MSPRWIVRLPFGSCRHAVLALTFVLASFGARPALADLPFTQQIVDPGATPWGKNLADVDGDGFLDALEGGGGFGQNVYWCRYPTWTRYQIGGTGGGDDLQVGDINNDGAVDVVVNGGPIVWYENPRGTGGNPQGSWTPRTIDNIVAHDLDIADINNDGKLDVLARAAFNETRVYLQNSPTSWTIITLNQAETAHQGAAFGDVDGDGRVDVIENGYWLQQPTDPVNGTWTKRVIGSFPSCSVDYADVNGDGRKDVTLAISEVGTGTLTWFEAPVNRLTGTWIRHDVATVTDVHRHHLVDMDRDGDLDIVFAEMHQSPTERVGIFFNQGGGASFALQTLSTQGSHNIAVGDIERDGDIDILGSNWNTDAPDGGGLRLWRCDATLTGVGTEDASGAPRVKSLGNAPNPFRVQTLIQFEVDGSLAANQSWTLRVYDVRGRLVRTVREIPAARHMVVWWDGTSDSGTDSPAGIYYYRMESGSLHSGGRMVLVR